MEFVEAIRKRAGKVPREVPREVEGKRRLRPLQKCEEVIAAVEAVRGGKAGEWMGRHGDPGKWLVAHLARKHCGMTLVEVGEALGDKDYVAVAMGIKRYEKRLKEEPKLRKERDRAMKKLNVKT